MSTKDSSSTTALTQYRNAIEPVPTWLTEECDSRIAPEAAFSEE